MRLYVDSIEEGIARVFLGEEARIAVCLPLSWLPKSVAEGEWLCCAFQRDLLFTDAQRKRTGEIMESLGDEP